jgi:hypothetical protein
MVHTVIIWSPVECTCFYTIRYVINPWTTHVQGHMDRRLRMSKILGQESGKILGIVIQAEAQCAMVSLE